MLCLLVVVGLAIWKSISILSSADVRELLLKKVRLFFVLQTMYKERIKQAKNNMNTNYLQYLALFLTFGLLCCYLSFLCCNFVARKETCNICNKKAI